jgi:hypothetical protein
MLPNLIHRIRRAPRRAPCPSCGRRGRRKRLLHRRVRTLAYRRVAWLEVTYAEYRSRCGCCKYFRTWPLEPRPFQSIHLRSQLFVVSQVIMP